MSTVPDKQRKALGKGLSALLPQRPAAASALPADTGLRVASIPIIDIHPNPLQPVSYTHLVRLPALFIGRQRQDDVSIRLVSLAFEANERGYKDSCLLYTSRCV